MPRAIPPFPSPSRPWWDHLDEYVHAHSQPVIHTRLEEEVTE